MLFWVVLLSGTSEIQGISTLTKQVQSCQQIKDLSCYAPNFEEVEGAYWFGPLRPSVTLFGS